MSVSKMQLEDTLKEGVEEYLVTSFAKEIEKQSEDLAKKVLKNYDIEVYLKKGENDDYHVSTTLRFKNER